MRTIGFCLAASFVVAACCAARADDAADIQGTWLVTDLKICGLHTKTDASDDQVFTITDKRIVVKYTDGTTREMQYKLDPQAKPKAIDLTHVRRKGEPAEHDWPGIYELDRDELILSLENGGPLRPQRFEPAGDSGIVYKLKRQRDAQKK
jgi:uncharacterized protein (TIGR03067 family)